MKDGSDNRSPTEITIQILEVINGYDNNNNEGLTQTMLMSKLFLSHEQMKEYLALLIDEGLITYDSTMSTFKTTEKGHTFFQAYNQMDKILKGQLI